MEKKPISLTWIISLAVLLAAAVFLYLGRGTVYAELNNLKLIPQPEQFTELYFQNSSDLPSAIAANQSISFSFTIHNVENETMAYPYEVYFEYPNGEKVDFVTGDVTLANGASTTIPVAHTFLSSDLAGEVIVNLPSLNNQSIDFLLSGNN